MTKSLHAAEETPRRPTPIEEDVRQVARMLVKLRGISLPEFALRLGISRTAASNRLGGPLPYSGKKPFTVTEVGMMAEFFEVPAALFLAGPAALLSRVSDVSIKTNSNPSSVSRRVAGSSPFGVTHLILAA